MQIEPNQQRKREHAKLFSTNHGQVVAYLNRDENDALTVLLQCWVTYTDEQLRACIRAEDDDSTQAIFDALTDEGVPEILDELGIPAMIAEIGARHG